MLTGDQWQLPRAAAAEPALADSRSRLVQCPVGHAGHPQASHLPHGTGTGAMRHMRQHSPRDGVNAGLVFPEV
jgi:hypothetical protein